MLRPISSGVFASVLLAAVLAASGPAFTQESKANCADPQTQMEMTQCAGEDYDKADKELNTQYRKLRAILVERDKAADDHSKGAEEALIAAQSAWIVFRDANCDFEGFQARAGTMEPQPVLSCLAAMSRARTNDLRKWTESF
ncbi:lysozyme inhibitor LprI family protein [Agrobacterium sp. SORGH_AS 787]|uniref:lysozyme inhibitor LprI family protein n=1 Tax=Agrobacterium sp. SORGH_AS 787 TaxID=3041775 RepID=UPI00278A069D|nr:uncharacterized protein YecT (DUF1311 family) [Rhizobium sp. SORGH_AS_0787]